MANVTSYRIALMIPGRSEDKVTAKTSRLAPVFEEFEKQKQQAELILFSNDRINEIEKRLLKFDLVMVWVNPIHEGKSRTPLDEMLLRVAKDGVIVATHPEIILKVGTKDVLSQTKQMKWGSDTYIYQTHDEFKERFKNQLENGVRVLKQYRGNGGNGVWRVELQDNDIVSMLHAKRGSIVEEMPLDFFYTQMEQYFLDNGHLIDQEFFPRLLEGMTRCYMSLDKVIGYGHQFVTALITPPNNEPLQAPPRSYYNKEKPEFQRIRKLLEDHWIAEMQELFDIPTKSLPLLWDADFLLGEKDESGEDTFKLCEINVSSVYPYPVEGNSDIVEAAISILKANKT